jgi:hypothetical protein
MSVDEGFPQTKTQRADLLFYGARPNRLRNNRQQRQIFYDFLIQTNAHKEK